MQLNRFRRDVTFRGANIRQQAAYCVASCAVDSAIGEALAWIATDPAELFLYKYPRECGDGNHRRRAQTAPAAPNDKPIDTAATATRAAATPATCNNNIAVRATSPNVQQVNWLRICDFSIEQIMQQLNEYLSLWRLSPSTKYVVQLETDVPHTQAQGSTYNLIAHFTTIIQPNPSQSNQPQMPPIAKVYFKVHVSRLLPNYYPVMVTYRFEKCNSVYYAVGKRRVRSLDFQRFYIDMTLEAKTGFYAQLLPPEPRRTRRDPERADQKSALDNSNKIKRKCNDNDSNNYASENSDNNNKSSDVNNNKLSS